jgi:hypothetical protein
MSIQKKSLIRAVKTTKKAKVASGPVGKKASSMAQPRQFITAKKKIEMKLHIDR